MATTIFSPSALLSASATSTSPKPKLAPKPQLLSKPLSSAITAASAAALLLTTSLPSLADPAFQLYYGTASSAANYGGYGGNSSKKDSAEYTYEVPAGWKERLVSKVEKGTNGTDSEFYNPKKRAEKEYLTFLAGFRSVPPVDAVLGNLALSDVGLQDLIAAAESVKTEEKSGGGGQVYYFYEVDGGPAGHSLIAVTCARNKLYAHFVSAPKVDWDRDEGMLRRLHDSFHTVGNF